MECGAFYTESVEYIFLSGWEVKTEILGYRAYIPPCERASFWRVRM
jgi:hypothetical protein